MGASGSSDGASPRDGKARDGGGAGGDSRGAGGDAAGNSGGGGCGPAAHCGAAGFLCGVHAVPSCGEIDCGDCRYRAETTGDGDITAAPDGQIHLAYLSDPQTLTYARVVGATLVPELVASMNAADGAGGKPSIAVAPDGTVHIVWTFLPLRSGEPAIWHAVKPPGQPTWEVRTVGQGTAAVVETDAVGQPHIVLRATGGSGRPEELRHATVGAAGYAVVSLAGAAPASDPASARGADGAIVVAYLGTTTSGKMLQLLELVDGSFQRDSTVPELAASPAEVSAAITTDGTVHLAAVTGQYTLRTGSELVRLARSGGSWTAETLVPTQPRYGRVTHDIALADGPQARLHLLFYSYKPTGLFATRPGSARELNLAPSCDSGTVRAAIDKFDQPHILMACNSKAGRYLTPVARFPDEYFVACDRGASLICGVACPCSAGDACCYRPDPQIADASSCIFTGAMGDDYCLASVRHDLCSEVTADPADLFACVAELEASGPQCIDGFAQVPARCIELMRSARL